MQIEDMVKDLLQKATQMMNLQYQKSKDAWRQNQNQQMMQQQIQSANFAQIHMQEALGRTLSTTQILPQLSAITCPAELVPAGCRISGNGNIYFFRWLKTNPQSISTMLLGIGVQKINSAIEIERRKMNQSFQALPDNLKVWFVQQYPALYNGFHVVGLKDVGTDVIIAAVFD